MIVDLPDTSANSIGKALVDLRERLGAVALGRVLTLVIVSDEEHAEDAIDAANDASHEHPCRIVVVVIGDPDQAARLDGQIRVGGDAGASEVLVLKAYGPLTQDASSLVMPLLLSDAPVVAWWPGEAPEAISEDPIARIAARRISDAAATKAPGASLAAHAEYYQPGDSDLAWARITRWRAVLASAVDQRPGQKIYEAKVVGEAESASTELFAAWLANALKVPVERVRRADIAGLVSVHLRFADGWLELHRPVGEESATLTFPGMPGRPVSLPRRPVGECLAEELRRLDPDDVYGEVLLKGIPRLNLSEGKAKGKKAKAEVSG